MAARGRRRVAPARAAPRARRGRAAAPAAARAPRSELVGAAARRDPGDRVRDHDHRRSASIWFALGILPLAIIALGELFDLYADAEPVRLAGFIGVIGGHPRRVLRRRLSRHAGAAGVLSGAVRDHARAAPAGTLGMAITVFGVVWIGVALAHGVLLRELPHGGGIIVDILVGTFVGDSGAYIGGRWFGQRKLAPSVSPNKTVEGLSSGWSRRCWRRGWPARTRTGCRAPTRSLLGIGVALAAPLGDLFESFIKRDAGHEGHRPPVRPARRRAGPPRRGAVHGGRRLLRLARCLLLL